MAQKKIKCKTCYERCKTFAFKVFDLCEFLGLKKPAVIKGDRRLRKYSASVTWYRHKNNKKIRKYVFRFNPDKIVALVDWQIINLILHELGHVKYSKNRNLFEAEYRAQNFALTIIRQYFPFYYSYILNYMSLYVEDSDVYGKVYRKLLEEVYLERRENETSS